MATDEELFNSVMNPKTEDERFLNNLDAYHNSDTPIDKIITNEDDQIAFHDRLLEEEKKADGTVYASNFGKGSETGNKIAGLASIGTGLSTDSVKDAVYNFIPELASMAAYSKLGGVVKPTAVFAALKTLKDIIREKGTDSDEFRDALVETGKDSAMFGAMYGAFDQKTRAAANKLMKRYPEKFWEGTKNVAVKVADPIKKGVLKAVNSNVGKGALSNAKTLNKVANAVARPSGAKVMKPVTPRLWSMLKRTGNYVMKGGKLFTPWGIAYLVADGISEYTTGKDLIDNASDFMGSSGNEQLSREEKQALRTGKDRGVM